MTMKAMMTKAMMVLAMAGLAAATAGAGTLVVANKAEATVSLVDVPSGEVRATLPVGEGPHEVAISPDGRLALVGNYGKERAGSTLTLVDVPGARVVRTIDLGRFRRPHGIVFLDGCRAVVTVEEQQALITVDVERGEVVQVADTGAEVSHMVAVAPGGGRAFVANIGSGSVSVVDLGSGRTVVEIATGKGAEGVAVTPDGAQVWVTNRAADTVTVLDAATLQTIAELASPSFPIRAEVTPDGARVLVSNARSGDLSVFATAEPALVRRVALPARTADTEGRLFSDRFGDSSVPIGIEIAPDGATAWIAHANADTITVLDLECGTVTGHLTAGREPDGMAYSPLEVERERGARPAPPEAHELGAAPDSERLVPTAEAP